MSEIIIFDHSDYRQYLELKLKTKEFGRGVKAKLAEYLSCQPSFVSQVLKDKSTFSLEQAYKVSSFLKHNNLERDYFMILIEKDRAGTVELKKFFDEKKNELKEKSKLVENQMNYDQLPESDTIAYYSNVNHVLIRNYIDIPQFNTVASVQKKLKLDEQEFKKALDFLIEKKLVIKTKTGRLERGHMRLHIKKESPLARFANISIRMHLLKNYEKTNQDSMNYASYMTIPRSRYDEFKKKLVALLVDINKDLADGSEAEMMAALVIDLMEI